MEYLSWDEAKNITQIYFLPFQCFVDKVKSDHQNVISFAIYYDYENSGERYGPFEIKKFNTRHSLETELSLHKINFTKSLASL